MSAAKLVFLRKVAALKLGQISEQVDFTVTTPEMFALRAEMAWWNRVFIGIDTEMTAALAVMGTQASRQSLANFSRSFDVACETAAKLHQTIKELYG